MPGEGAGRIAARPVQDAARWLWGRSGRSFTEHEVGASCLVVAPHPDDETLGCGATIARKVSRGARVVVVVATDGRASHRVAGPEVERLVTRRKSEAVAACAALGVPEHDVVFLDLVDGQLTASAAELRGGLAHVLGQTPVEQVLVPASCDGHPDHDVVAGVVRSLVDPRTGPQVFEYPVWLWRHWPFTSPRRRVGPLGRSTVEPLRRVLEQRPRTVATAGFLGAKRAALACYGSQVGTAVDAALPPDFVRPFLGAHEFFLPLGALDHLGRAR